MKDKEHTPGWIKLLIGLSALPLLWWPVSLLHDTGFVFDGTVRMLVMLFPFYAILSLGFAWHCRNERREAMWVLLVLLWLSYGAIYTLASVK